MAAPGAQLKPELRQALDDFVGQNKIVLFMKGTQQVSRELLCVILQGAGMRLATVVVPTAR